MFTTRSCPAAACLYRRALQPPALQLGKSAVCLESPHLLRSATRSMGGAPYPRPARRASSYGEKDVWGIFTPLAIKHDAVNLGQGFPNLPAPSFVKVCGRARFLYHPDRGRAFGLPLVFVMVAYTHQLAVQEAACEAIEADLNQYAPSKGLPRLRKVGSAVCAGSPRAGCSLCNQAIDTHSMPRAPLGSLYMVQRGPPWQDH